MFPAEYTPFQYGDGKSLIEASVIIIVVRKHEDNFNPTRERKYYASNCGTALKVPA